MQDTKERAAIAALQWINRQDNPGANDNARVLLAISNLNGKAASIYDVVKLSGVSMSACNVSVSQLRRAGYINGPASITDEGTAQVLKIIHAKP